MTSLEELLSAALRASRKCPSSPARAEFLFNMSLNCLRIREQLLNGTYVWGPYETKEVCDPKRRIIHKAPFKDRVVHQSIAATIEPILERRLIHHTFACRKNKGTNHALETAMHWLNTQPAVKYALKMDISKYFASIDRPRLVRKINRLIDDDKLRSLLESLVFSFPAGIPIGNLTSQLFANLYLNELDHFIKRQLKLKFYIRYMDDLLVLTTSKEDAWKARDAIQAFAANEGLVITERKTSVHPTSAGVPFLGYRLFAKARPRIQRRKIRRLKECLAKADKKPNRELKRWATIAGWYGSAKYGIPTKLARDLGVEKEIMQLKEKHSRRDGSKA